MKAKALPFDIALVAIVVAALVVTVAPAPSAASEPLTLLPLGPQDLAATHLEPLPAPDSAREPLHFSWPLSAENRIDSHTAPHRAESRSHTRVVDADQLRQGFELNLASPGAVVHIAPLTRAGAEATDFVGRITHRDLVVTTPSGVAANGATALEAANTAETPAHLTLATRVGLSAFRVPAELGSGAFTFKAPELQADNGRYRVHVLERASDVSLELAAGANAYLDGDTLEVEARLLADRPASLRSLTGVAVSPAGDRFPLTFEKGPNDRYTAKLVLEAGQSADGLPWKIGARAEATRDGMVIRRDAQNVVAVAVPIARLTGAVHSVSDDAGLRISFGIEAASASRNEIRGVLFGTSSDGQLQPLAAAHSARWVEAGHDEITLSFDEDTLSASALSGPYEVRDLRLIDQGQRGTLHHQARAARIE